MTQINYEQVFRNSAREQLDFDASPYNRGHVDGWRNAMRYLDQEFSEVDEES